MEKSFISWSGGKDCCLALYETPEVDLLVTNFSAAYGRVSMHGVQEVWMDRQAEALGLSLDKVRLAEMPTMEAYEEVQRKELDRLRGNGYGYAIFGDLFLEDLKRYREALLAPSGIEARFPLWGRNTEEVARRFIGLGFRATVVCVDGRLMDASFAGRPFDEAFLRDLPSGVDPCGERGEFHTFVTGGPLFHHALEVTTAPPITRIYPSPTGGDAVFYFCDLA